MCSTNQGLLDQLSEVLAGLASTAAVDRAAVGGGDRIRMLLAALAQLEAVVLDEVAAFDTAGACVDDGAATTAAWLRASARLGRRDASGLVHQARELRTLPATTDALQAGVISRAHAVEVVKAKKRSCLDADAFSRYEQILVELATHASPDEVRAAVAHLVEAEAPDRDKQLLDALADRTFTLHPVGDLVKVDAMIDKATAEALAVGVDALSRRSSGDERSWQVRRADAFAEIVALGLESGQLPQAGRTKPHLNITMTLDQLTGIDGTGPLLARFGQVPATTTQRLACDAVLTRFVTDAHGEVLDVGRGCRFTNTALNKALALMYDSCAYPNCTTPLSRCDIHHAWWWSQGGPTDRWNLLPLCKHHHLFVHEYGYQILTGIDPPVADSQRTTTLAIRLPNRQTHPRPPRHPAPLHPPTRPPHRPRPTRHQLTSAWGD